MVEADKFKGLWTCPDYAVRLNDKPPFEYKCTGMNVTNQGVVVFEAELMKQFLKRN